MPVAGPPARDVTVTALVGVSRTSSLGPTGTRSRAQSHSTRTRAHTRSRAHTHNQSHAPAGSHAQRARANALARTHTNASTLTACIHTRARRTIACTPWRARAQLQRKGGKESRRPVGPRSVIKMTRSCGPGPGYLAAT